MKPPRFLPFIEWLDCPQCGAITYGILRLFQAPFSAINEDGMPSQPYIWTCNVEKEGDVVTLKAAMSSPPAGSIRALLAYGGLFAKTVQWERQRGTTLHPRSFDLA